MSVQRRQLVQLANSPLKWLYFFDEGVSDKKLLGGKGAGLCEMTSLGLPIPPGFVITTTVCEEFYKKGQKLPDGLMDSVFDAMESLEERTGKKFGDPANPLLVSVRSGAAVSMPGMMDTILNLGLNDQVVEGLVEAHRATGGSPTTPTGGSSSSSGRWSSGSTRRSSPSFSKGRRGGAARHRTATSTPTR